MTSNSSFLDFGLILTYFVSSRTDRPCGELLEGDGMIWVELEYTDIRSLAEDYLRLGMEATRCRCRDACDCCEAVDYYGDRAEMFYELLPYEEQRLFWGCMQPELERHREVMAIKREKDRREPAGSLPTEEELRRFQEELRQIRGCPARA